MSWHNESNYVECFTLNVTPAIQTHHTVSSEMKAQTVSAQINNDIGEWRRRRFWGKKLVLKFTCYRGLRLQWQCSGYSDTVSSLLITVTLFWISNCPFMYDTGLSAYNDTGYSDTVRRSPLTMTLFWAPNWSLYNKNVWIQWHSKMLPRLHWHFFSVPALSL